MTKRVVNTLAYDPNLYSSENMQDEDFRDILFLFLGIAVKRQVMAIDEQKHILKLLIQRIPEIKAKWNDIGTRMEECLMQRRFHNFTYSEQMSRTAELVEPLAQLCEEHQHEFKMALSLAGETNVDGVLVSRLINEFKLELKDQLPENIKLKIQKPAQASELFTDLSSESLFGKKRTDIEDRWIDPVLKWGETITIVDKHIGDAHKNGSNWESFKATILWLYNRWRTHKTIQRRRFEIITHPAHKTKEPNIDDAGAIWDDLGEHKDIFVTIVKEVSHYRDNNSKTKLHERYLNSMPMDFTLNFGAGFDLLATGKQAEIERDSTIVFCSDHPPYLKEVLNLRKSGVTYPTKNM